MNSNSSDNVTVTINQFKSFFDIYKNIASYLNLDQTKQEYIEQRKVWIKRLKQEEFPVAFFGSFTAGKSTIINAILGRDVLPEAVESTTAFPTIIRKGESDKAFVFFINENAKKTLWNQLCSEIGEQINQNLDKQPNDTNSTHLSRIRGAFLTYEGVNPGIDRKPLDTLEQLSQGWEIHKSEKSQIQLDDLKQYVEGYKDSLFIDRIEVHLENIDIPDDIVLVDLPGLAVANKRHVQFTKEYIEEKAKAFVVCMKPKHLLEGEEIDFLAATNKKNPTILKRSFWVINQWDTLNEVQKQEEENNFQNKVRQYNFTIIKERCFKFSALNYLLLHCIANDAINNTQKLKSHLSNLQRYTSTDPTRINSEEARDLQEHYEISPFIDFRKELFRYLNEEAKDEFIVNARGELLKAVELVNEPLENLYNLFNQDGDFTTGFQAVETSNELKSFLKKLEEKVNQFSIEVNKNISSKFWQESDTNYIEKEIDQSISKIDRDQLMQALTKGSHVEFMLSRLPTLVEEELKVDSLLTTQIVATIEKPFIRRLSQLFLELKDVNKDYWPDTVLKIVQDKLGSRDISMRLNGVTDSLLYEYGNKVDEIGLSLKKNEGNSKEEQARVVLEEYRQGLKKYVNSLVENLNKYIRRSIKNHAEYLDQELKNLFHKHSDSITKQVSEQVKKSEAIELQKQKRTAVIDNYTALEHLRNELMGKETGKSKQSASQVASDQVKN